MLLIEGVPAISLTFRTIQNGFSTGARRLFLARRERLLLRVIMADNHGRMPEILPPEMR
jgi:hypothetical protein